jgi:DNA-directed RNA polymerase subunit alpha
MELSVRALNCLKAAEVETLGDLVSYNKNDLMKFRNFGKKSLTELEELVNIKGLNFGMDLAKYKLDRD